MSDDPKYKVNIKTKKALQESILHWAEVVEKFKEFVEENAKDDKCALCKLYIGRCQECPIAKDSKPCATIGAYWQDFTHGAERMRDYLVELDNRCRVKKIKRGRK